MTPEDAVALARERAAAARARGLYADDLAGFTAEPADRVSTERLLEWAVIEPDLEVVRSTRRFGGPITWAKRALARALRQWIGDAFAQQTRFNLHVVLRLAELEERLDATKGSDPSVAGRPDATQGSDPSVAGS